jgi:chemotaxis regulatin CheY-phosphate phosphatase CheZ
MRELGLDKHVERAAEAVPDARDRLKYIASMTEQAAERVLNAIDVAKPMQEQLQPARPNSTRAGSSGMRRRSNARKCAR